MTVHAVSSGLLIIRCQPLLQSAGCCPVRRMFCFPVSPADLKRQLNGRSSPEIMLVSESPRVEMLLAVSSLLLFSI